MSSLLALSGGLILGVFAQSLFVFSWPPILFALLISALCAGAYLRKTRNSYVLAAMFFLCVALGAGRMALADTSLPSAFEVDLKQHVTYQGIVVADPTLSDTSLRIPVQVNQRDQSTIVLVNANRGQSVGVGDRVSVSGTLELPRPFATDGGRTFRYDKFLEKDGIRFVLSFANVSVIRPAPWYSLPATLAWLKHLFVNGIAAALPEPSASLAAGLAIGGKVGLGTELLQAFVVSGLVQIVVLSGYNVMVVAEGIMALLAACKLSRRNSAVAGALALVLFVGIAGVSSTAIRAALMALIALYARATARSYAAGRALLVVIFLMLVWNPFTLVFDPGFNLSVAATAGLIWLAPLIEVKLARIKSTFWRNTIATTLAAQLAVLPLLLYETGRLSLYSIPANILTLPMVPLAMALSTMAGIGGILFGSIAPFAAIALGAPAYIANTYIIFVARTIASLPYAGFVLPVFPFVFVPLAYAIIAYIAFAKRSSMTVQLMLSKKASM